MNTDHLGKFLINDWGIQAFVTKDNSAIITGYIDCETEVEIQVSDIEALPGGFENLDICGLLELHHIVDLCAA